MSSHDLKSDESGKMYVLNIKRKWAEISIYILLIALNIFYYTQALELPFYTSAGGIGAGGFPVIIAVANLLLLMGLVVISLKEKRKETTSLTINIPRPIYVLAAIALLLCEVSLLSFLGPIVTIALFSFLLIWVAGERRWRLLLIIPPVLAASIYAVFVLALGVYFD